LPHRGNPFNQADHEKYIFHRSQPGSPYGANAAYQSSFYKQVTPTGYFRIFSLSRRGNFIFEFPASERILCSHHLCPVRGYMFVAIKTIRSPCPIGATHLIKQIMKNIFFIVVNLVAPTGQTPHTNHLSTNRLPLRGIFGFSPCPVGAISFLNFLHLKGFCARIICYPYGVFSDFLLVPSGNFIFEFPASERILCSHHLCPVRGYMFVAIKAIRSPLPHRGNPFSQADHEKYIFHHSQPDNLSTSRYTLL
jgi:hypothetical protein